MKALLTTSFSVFALDSDELEAPIVERGRGLYYGIAKRGPELFVTARRRHVSSAVPIHEERGCLIRFDARFRPEVIEAPFPLRDLHGAVFNGEELLVACSYDNFIARYRDGAWSKWRPLGEPAGEPRDRNHFNTFLAEKDVLHVVAHNWGESEVLEFSRDDYRLLARRRLGTSAHNVWRNGEALMVCSSGEGKLVGTDGVEIVTGEFPRGYARDEKIALIGLTTHAAREERDASRSAVLVMSRDYVPLGRIALPGEGMILEIAPISDAQYCAALERSRESGYGSVKGIRFEPSRALVARNAEVAGALGLASAPCSR